MVRIIHKERYPTIRKTIDQLAREVINGKWGNGKERKRRLTNV